MNLRFLTAGESHGPGLLMILEGLPAGLPLAAEDIDQELFRRQTGYGAGPRMKLERDRAEIISGLMDGVTIGSPVGIKINNLDHSRWANKPIPAFTTPRP
ncbi:MAG TPA: chorismate synthase, partial [Anaerolineales bacterium]|nr:chorismate synthase [Anaerolineales bacterium]